MTDDYRLRPLLTVNIFYALCLRCCLCFNIARGQGSFRVEQGLGDLRSSSELSTSSFMERGL